jgi:hypothetical protein
MLPERAKISIGLDCWTSSFGQALMAITGYFIDADWVYREVLLVLKSLRGTHFGVNLSTTVIQTVTQHEIEDRISGLTTDNASNNNTLVDTLQQSLLQQSLSHARDINITRIPCLAHVI